ncbi:CRISPR-associated protein Cmr1 [Lampropedia hyalina DSM 16112]|jgi:CRISPR-associated protein Cmr1|uniref:CRISPR-associated protein Cmr1 n=1 Tax=Lampropedia hyalina DSM 16112 TaxID=1122156 RepID=A0A1M4YDC9_9BURK|nr:hypothetical protein [Lampropedia hyalina]SHF03767.1 CRISPR-associated protein Cmr1 [Lampropedia hyalina DSM 16112]
MTVQSQQIRQYSLHFNTPAFLGNAQQNAQWRTPPIKALLRQWWRVAYAADRNFKVDVAAMRREEGLLFGHAWLEDDVSAARKSALRLRLSHWNAGALQQQQWPQFGTVRHDEVPRPVAADLYLGYGPVTLPKGGSKPTLKANAAIQADEQADFSLAYPAGAAPLLEHALALTSRFGTLGGRSRNGWGSLHLAPHDGTPALQGALPLRDWQQALTLDWPHAIGQDKCALIWQTRPFDDWQQLMQELARIKIALRTQFNFTLDGNAGDKQLYNKKREEIGIAHGQPQNRHWLSYPVTHHSVRDWGNQARLPNSLRFKVLRTGGASGQFVGLIFHMPCLPPAAFRPSVQEVQATWQQVHRHLDQSTSLTRTQK